MGKHSFIIVAAMATGLLFLAPAGPASSGTGNTDAVEVKSVWRQGLSAYLAMSSPAGEGKQAEGWALRKETMLTYAASVNPKNELSLRELKGEADRVLPAIEQAKAALVFHQLRRLSGERIFFRAVKALRERESPGDGSWEEVRGLFEKETGQDFAWFFKQWVDRKGLPDLRVENPSVRRSGSRFEVSFDLLQRGDVYTLDVPVFIAFLTGGGKTEIVKTDSEKKQVVLLVDEEPAIFAVDRDYDVPRRLMEQETPPAIAALLGSEKPLIVLPASNKEAYKPVIAFLKERGAKEREEAGLKDADIMNSSLAILGEDNPLIGRLFGRVESAQAGFALLARKNPWNERSAAVIVNARSAAEISAALPGITRYAQFSSLAFDQGRLVTKKTDDSQRGMEMELRAPATAIDLSLLKSLNDVIEGAAGKKIVYVGEYHDRFAHHTVQLQTIKGLVRKTPKLAIGMEMFQRPFQKVLDDYLDGKIDERAFLKKSEYFKRWGFDYNLYKPILDYARAGKIPVVALNVRTEIVEKVSKDGMDSLTDDERKELPAQMDFSDDEYRDRLKEIFSQHKNPGEKSFDFFYQAQVLWDETMAMSVDEYLNKNPDSRMVVIAGGGHLAYGSGIPKRAFRRNGFPYSIILNDSEVDQDIANYLVLPQPLEGLSAPKLMAALKVEQKRVTVVDLPGESVSRKAGVKTGDVILALDGQKVESVEDIKVELFYKHKDDIVQVKVLRKRFLLGDKEIELDVKL